VSCYFAKEDANVTEDDGWCFMLLCLTWMNLSAEKSLVLWGSLRTELHHFRFLGIESWGYTLNNGTLEWWMNMLHREAFTHDLVSMVSLVYVWYTSKLLSKFTSLHKDYESIFHYCSLLFYIAHIIAMKRYVHKIINIYLDIENYVLRNTYVEWNKMKWLKMTYLTVRVVAITVPAKTCANES